MTQPLSAEGFRPRLGCLRQTIRYGDFTDGGGASGNMTLDEKMPAGALVLGWAVNVREAFTGATGGTTAVTLSVGISGGDTGAWTGLGTDPSIYTAGYKGALAFKDGTDGANSVVTATTSVQLTAYEVEAGANDWTNIDTGVLDLYIYFIKAIPGVT